MLTDQLFLISIAVLTLVVLLVLGMVLYFAARRSHAKPSSDPKVARIRFDSLRSSFRQAVELIEGNIASRADRYGIPWIMLLNEGDDHRQLPIEQSGVASALSTESASAATTQGISWHFFDRGVVIDIQGAYLGSPDDDDASEKPWDEFLGMCRSYRPQRPFDSVVITIPAALLLDDSTDGRLELSKRAKLAHRRLWLAQNRFAMRFAVYVLVTGAEHLEGFSAFASALPEPLRASMLGWSSPYDLSTTYQPAWVDEAVGTVVRSVSDVSAELFATGTEPQGAGPQLLLPSRIEALRGQLQLYVDELMRPSAYHEPFFFRGIYLTGDSGESAQTVAAIDSEHDAYGQKDLEPIGGDLIAQLMRQPAFLRDLFEKKIFLEYGLTRPSRTQTLTRPVLHRALRWAAVLFLGGWGIGLMVATWQLNRHNATLVSALSQLQHDAQYRMRALQRGETIPTAWYRNKALSLLAMNERLRTDGTYSFFMPGSWQPFDDLNERVIERIEREFGDIAVSTLRRELMARVSQLSGVEQDEATGEFITGASCGLPPSFKTIGDAPRKNGLLVEDQPEFGALQRYLGSVEQLDAALQAVERLRQPSTGNADDLRVAVRYALGAELPADLSRNLRYFRQAAEGNALAIPLAPVQSALRCALDKGTAQLDARLFVNNELLVSEQSLARLLPSLASTGTFARTTASYREVIAAIKDQEDLIASGKGGWMRQPVLVLGASYDRTIARIEQNRLLGLEPADAVRSRAQDAFQKFRAEFNLRFGGAQPGLVWQDKEGRFALAPERIALRDALTALLAQPFMAAARDRELPGAGMRGMAAWDLPRLDQALAVGDIRKRYMSEGMQAFPATLRPGIEAALNAHFAQLVVDQVAEAANGMSDGGRATDTQAAAYEASRQRLAKIQALLYELGAGARAEDLRAMISRDALQRLEAVDEAFNQSELYAMRGRDFQGWRGERGPMLVAFGVSDAGSLAAYLGQQFNRTEALGKLADSYISALDGAGAGSVLAQRWQAINRDLERYRLKNPNSSLLLLEQFLGTTGAEIDRETCGAKLAGKAPATRIGDYFADRHQQIYSALLARCQELQFGDQQELWTQFSTRFNRSLAGRHPFGPATGRAFELADPADVNDLARAFDPLARALKENRGIDAGGMRGPGMQGAGARRFAEQFGRARDFLLPLFPTEDGAAPGYDLSVDFRANTTAEIEGSKIIDWSFEVGDQVLRLRDAPRTLRWEYGMPVALVLRIAKDSPLMARADPQQHALITDGQTVSFRFADPWALFTLAQRQREGDPAQRPDGRSQLLKFEFPLVAQSAGDAAQAPDGGRARVFLRIAASPAGKKNALIWPTAFPTRAPEWNMP
ncbi:type VI secretion system protein [Variovorax sp. NFACC27]|uniref:type VI secretion system protein n=1 Tax=unclassified Variovorax TaxID=663243 RepID=UPI00089CB8FD|nr:type VI secretion system protein ImpL [Variovorax sp. NFACC28]SEG33858.1 type VI secretion system protein ImpL [Variovorax sp. NFACC29]SFC37695.1 type VI secretion system protein ImpL [Variovorax sp. NFACC26]SFF89033.1 type VI secretion system protein ImpL [Variovorax sp. NFACC27]